MVEILKRTHKPDLAFVYSEGAAGNTMPLIMFCGGYKSDMDGTKATYFEAQCQNRGQAYLRFDYSGHGQSDGKFEDGTIGSWSDDALEVLAHVNQENKPVILVGSSMGGWISLLMLKKNPQNIVHMVGIAAAPDFTRDMYAEFTEGQKMALAETGKLVIQSEYPDPYILKQGFFDDAEHNFVMDQSWNLPCNLHLFQGMKDTVVKPQKAQKIQDFFGVDKVSVTYSENGGHNMSNAEDLKVMDEYLHQISAALQLKAMTG